MSAFRKRSTDDHELVGRINSEHLSDQFQRELSNTVEDDLLHDDELKLDDIHNASGPPRAMALPLTMSHMLHSSTMVSSFRQRNRSACRNTASGTQHKT